MEIPIAVAVFGIAALAVLFFLARKVIRLAVRLMLAAVLVIILVAGGLFWWWPGIDSSANRNTNRTSVPARRTSNAR
jgi:ABC-type microcin C transport system permease subunit YejB